MFFKTRHANKLLPVRFFWQKDHIINNPTCPKNNLFTSSMIKTLEEEKEWDICLSVIASYLLCKVKVIFVFIQSFISFGCLKSGFWHTKALIEFAVCSSKVHEVKSGWAVGGRDYRERCQSHSIKTLGSTLLRVCPGKKLYSVHWMA